MRRYIFHTVIRFILLAIPYCVFFYMFAESGYKGEEYGLDTLPLYVFAGLLIYFFVETFFWFRIDFRWKAIINYCLIAFFIMVYFILPHREIF